MKNTYFPRIWLSSPHMGNNELHYINQAFEMNWVAPIGPQLEGFENDMKRYTGVGGVVALSSGTAAIHLALKILGVQSGDEVICQSLTFVASANPIVYLGATPVFVDSEKDTWNICPRLLRQAILARLSIGKKPKAIVIVHLYGMPAKVEEIMEVAREFGIPVVEDAAEALGSTYANKPMGSFGEFGVFSFNGNKIITTSGGGMLLSKNLKRIQSAHFLATQARDAFPHYEHTQTGYNYRMSNISAAIGRGQMEVLEERIALRRNVFNYYKQQLSSLNGISFVDEPEDVFCNRWLTIIMIDPARCGMNREDIRLNLEKENIEARPVWKPMHLQPLFKDAPFYGGGHSEAFFKDGLCLPSGSNLTTYDLDRVIEVIERTLALAFHYD